MVLPSSLVLVLLLPLEPREDVPAADWSLLVTGLMMVSLKDLATDLVSALISNVSLYDLLDQLVSPVHCVQVSSGH